MAPTHGPTQRHPRMAGRPSWHLVLGAVAALMAGFGDAGPLPSLPQAAAAQITPATLSARAEALAPALMLSPDAAQALLTSPAQAGVREDRQTGNLIRMAEDHARTQTRLADLIQALPALASALDSARQQHAAGDFAAAETTLTSLLDRAPSDRDRALLMGEVAGLHVAQGREPDGAVLFAEAAEILAADPENASTRNRLIRAQADAFAHHGQRTKTKAEVTEAITLLTRLLDGTDRAQAPVEWAMTQAVLGHAYAVRADLTWSLDAMEQATAAYRAALEERDDTWARLRRNWATALTTEPEAPGIDGIRPSDEADAAQTFQDRDPVLWARTQHNLGLILRLLYPVAAMDRTATTATVTAYRHALEVRTREQAPLAWAETQDALGEVLGDLAARPFDPVPKELAFDAFEQALTERTRDRAPYDWARTQANLAHTQARAGRFRQDAALLARAFETYRLAQQEWTQGTHPMEWAYAEQAAAETLCERGTLTNDPAILKQSVEMFRGLLSAGQDGPQQPDVPLWRVGDDFADALQALGTVIRSTATLEEAVDLRRRVVDAFQSSRRAWEVANAQNDLGFTLRALAEVRGDREALVDAIRAHEAALATAQADDRMATASMTEGYLRDARQALAEYDAAAGQ